MVLCFSLWGCRSDIENTESDTSDTIHTVSQEESEQTDSQIEGDKTSSASSFPSKAQSSAEPQSSALSTPPVSSTVAPPVPPESTPQQLLSDMTLEEKVAQLFIVYPEALNIDPATGSRLAGSVTAANDNLKKALSKYPVGGFIMFAANAVSPAQLTSLIKGLKGHTYIPPFFSVDEEGGNVARLSNNPAFSLANFGSALYLGGSDKVYSTYNYIGKYLKDYGFNLDFAPVADIYTNPSNTVIGSRAFGRDAATVVGLLPHAVKGLEDNNVISCIKHFPGHGDTVGDTHNGLVTLNKTWEQLLSTEIVPFKSAIEKGADMIMAAHITLPKATSEAVPASLSKEMLTDKLRVELGFKGIIITDSLSMGAITKHYSARDAAIKAFCAGADILLMPQDFVAAYNGILEEIKSGKITKERLDESVLRILLLKEKYSLLKE